MKKSIAKDLGIPHATFYRAIQPGHRTRDQWEEFFRGFEKEKQNG